MTSTIEQQHLQSSEAVVGHPPAWSVAAVDDMKHCLTFATLTLITSCKAPLSVAGCAVTLVSPKLVFFEKYCHSWLPDSGVIHKGVSELTTKADFQSFFH